VRTSVAVEFSSCGICHFCNAKKGRQPRRNNGVYKLHFCILTHSIQHDRRLSLGSSRICHHLHTVSGMADACSPVLLRGKIMRAQQRPQTKAHGKRKRMHQQAHTHKACNLQRTLIRHVREPPVPLARHLRRNEVWRWCHRDMSGSFTSRTLQSRLAIPMVPPSG